MGFEAQTPLPALWQTPLSKVCGADGVEYGSEARQL